MYWPALFLITTAYAVDPVPVGPWLKIDCAGHVDVLAIGPDGNTLAVATNDGTVHIWDVRRKRDIGTIRDGKPFERVKCLCFADPTTLIIARLAWQPGSDIAETHVSSWGIDQIVKTQFSVSRGRPISISSDGTKLLVQSGSKGRSVDLIETSTGKTVPLIESRSQIRLGALSCDARVASVCDADGLITVLEVTTGKKLGTGQLDYIPAFLIVSPDGKFLVYRHKNSGRLIARLTESEACHEIRGLGPVLFHDNKTIAVIRSDAFGKPWISFVDLATRREVKTRRLTTEDSGRHLPLKMALSRDGRWVAEYRIGPDEATGSVRVWRQD